MVVVVVVISAAACLLDIQTALVHNQWLMFTIQSPAKCMGPYGNILRISVMMPLLNCLCCSVSVHFDAIAAAAAVQYSGIAAAGTITAATASDVSSCGTLSVCAPLAMLSDVI